MTRTSAGASWARGSSVVDLYVDESKSKCFCMVGVVVARHDMDRVSRAMQEARVRGSSWIHFTKEKDAERSRILRVISALPVQALVVEATATKGKVARDQVLAAVTRWAVEHGVARMVLDLDASTLQSDRRVIRQVLVESGGELEYDHRRSRESPLLWLPDAVAWCWTRGGRWRQSADEVTNWVVSVWST